MYKLWLVDGADKWDLGDFLTREEAEKEAEAAKKEAVDANYPELRYEICSDDTQSVCQETDK